ncbi:GNAT family N-acetyltransferase [Pseudodesulfovibrio sp. zrk46]|uniref:GNAT family N-acetyltransferase n=1 Tax=Pseudodesulfovibrio sp. zrk46 TaxID=2725288 RepID=UPI001449E70B|nr:GNAT family N-acetyltransferase [Pseudodesulfovibrio sp. zrk46]QJB57174.1 GNAT family N-acetyltransferase [Pseudodesulfovibrio sp. zrk46]
MSISFSDTKELCEQELQDLFLSVDWDSGNYPEKLVKAIQGAHGVFTAWDGDKLVGLINVLSDGHMAAYVHYLLVRPEYQGKGIGKLLIEQMAEAYQDVPTKLLISYNTKAGFYERQGFVAATDKSPMFMTSMRL